MAKHLNASRVRDSRLVVIIALAIILFTKPYIADESEAHELLEYIGYFMVAICVIGRVYCTAFLGGHKNASLITYGPFSVCRNPLYAFSFLGATGIAFISNHPILIVTIPTVILIVYISLIKREEAFLKQEFGTAFDAYCARVPRLIPKLSLYEVPETIPMNPRFLLRAIQDGIWWFAAFPLIEFIEYLHETGRLLAVF
ncbi:MAG: isoprenylcysteine carboxylmethyltransferase family protein [Alphaproteobacteria bacterium]|nr:isoprenylcysteine carboxylmethyltransferase family protein [Alphaproteobacteria bacterium]